ncbi:MAG: hypothetical protein COT00_05110 [Candidatus Omnitrophica bacterium CG07_land_8_20_14_0_80_50_8]|nr:MAG: hypothetical protein COT00_05110 [Candidatus Omnitrophica bacterium CG07_land_8_20_14_0_80_50_8]
MCIHLLFLPFSRIPCGLCRNHSGDKGPSKQFSSNCQTFVFWLALFQGSLTRYDFDVEGKIMRPDPRNKARQNTIP